MEEKYLNKEGLEIVSEYIKNKLTTVETMPTASVDHLGEIVQYVGPDTTTSPIYKKGKFYECEFYDSSYRWLSVDLVRGVNHAMYSEAWGGTDSKEDLIDTLNAFNDDFIEAVEGCDISANMALYSCYVDTPYEGMPTNTQIKAYYDSDAGWVYRGYSSSTADEFAIIPTGEAPNITEITITKTGGGTLYADNPIGSIVPYGGATAPTGWFLCNGQAVSRTTYADLFAAIGTSFGAGDGSTTFNLPDLRETVPVGIGENGTQTIGNHDTYTLGEYKDDQLQNITGNTDSRVYAKGATNSGSGALRYVKNTTTKAIESAYTDSYGNITFDASRVVRTGTTTHGKQLGVNYIIKAEHTPVPADFLDAVDKAVEDAAVDVVENSNMKAVTSNAVYNAIKSGGKTKPEILTTRCVMEISYFEPMTWNGYTNIAGAGIWSDGNNIYYSINSKQYILDKETSTWNTKTWNGLSNLVSQFIWSDGDNIYHSNGTTYILDKETSTWNTKTWNGLSNFLGFDIWSDGDNIYYSNYADQYVLDKETSTWNAKTWNGLSSFYGDYVWSDGDSIYYSFGADQYVLDKETSTWNAKTWNGLSSFFSDRIWSDGDSIYYSIDDNEIHYVLNKGTSTWNKKTWNGLSSFLGNYIWSDGDSIYYSEGANSYIMKKTKVSLRM